MPTRNLAVNTAMRYVAMLMLIPARPGKISTSQILRRLQENSEKYGVTKRSVQRDMELLAADWDISFEEIGRSKFWYFNSKSSLLLIPEMGESTALALRLAEENLINVMPGSALELLEGYFKHARAILKDTKLGAWQQKVKIIHKGPRLIVPKIKPEVQEVVYQALLDARKIVVTYRNRQGKVKTYPLTPLGIVNKDGLIYLVACAWDMEDPAQYALHRILRAELSEEPARPPSGFSLESYVHKREEFSYPLSEKKLKLVARFAHGAGLHLYENWLSEDQKINELPDGRHLVTATVGDTLELRWWLLAFGSGVTVEKPVTLRREIQEKLRKAMDNYRSAKPA